MFAQPRLRSQSMAGLYQDVHVDTGVNSATPHRLVAMLFDGFLDSCAQARGAIQTANVELKGRAMGRAVRIIEEGLKAGLNHSAGNQLAADLRDLYGYIVIRLTHANIRNDEQAVEECRRLIEPLRDAWLAIGDRANRVN